MVIVDHLGTWRVNERAERYVQLLEAFCCFHFQRAEHVGSALKWRRSALNYRRPPWRPRVYTLTRCMRFVHCALVCTAKVGDRTPVQWKETCGIYKYIWCVPCKACYSYNGKKWISQSWVVSVSTFLLATWTDCIYYYLCRGCSQTARRLFHVTLR